MYTVDDLFDMRSVVGAKLEDIIAHHGYTKAKLCREAAVSRPTLDKLLEGAITNKTNFEKHITKILEHLSITPDDFMGKTKSEYSRARAFRNAMNVSSEKIAEATGISMERLLQMESGADVSVAELRDVAFYLGIGVQSMQGYSYFDTHVAKPETILSIYGEKEREALSGFWGFVGIQPANMEAYLWYPISYDAYQSVYKAMDEPYVVIPCMNNRVLLVNLNNVDDVAFSGESCDTPSVYFQGVPMPQVIYEAMEDVLDYGIDRIPEDRMSPAFKLVLEKYMQDAGLDEDGINDLFCGSEIYYQSGKKKKVFIDFTDQDDMLSCLYFQVYNMGCGALSAERARYKDFQEIEHVTPLNNISVFAAPLLAINEAIRQSIEDAL